MLIRNMGKTDGYRFGVDRIAEDRVSKFVGPHADVEFQKSRAVEQALAGSDFTTPKALSFDVAAGRVEFEYIGDTTRLMDVIKHAYLDRDISCALEVNREAAKLLATLQKNLKLDSAARWEPPEFLHRDVTGMGVRWTDLSEVYMHCDYSPVNILVKPNGDLVLVDASPNHYLTNRADLIGPNYLGVASYTAKLYWPFRLRTYTLFWRRMAHVLRQEFIDVYETQIGLQIDRKLLRVFEHAVVRSFVLWKSELFLVRQPAMMLSRISLPASLAAFFGVV